MLSKATFCQLRSPPHTLSKTSVVFFSRFKTEVHIYCRRFFFREKSDSQILRFLIFLSWLLQFANINNIRINRNCAILFFKMVGTTKWVVVVLALLIVVTKGKMSFEFYLHIFLENYSKFCNVNHQNISFGINFNKQCEFFIFK